MPKPKTRAQMKVEMAVGRARETPPTPYQLANEKAPRFGQSADPHTRSLQQGFEHGWSHGTTGDITSFDRDLLGTTTNAESAKKGFFFARDPQNPPEHLTKKSNDQAAIEMLRKAGIDVDALNTVSMEGHGVQTASDYSRIGGNREYKDVVNKSNAAFARGDYDEYERLQDIVEDLYKAQRNESQGLVARHGDARDVMLDKIQRAFYDPMAGKSQAELEAFDKQYGQLFPHNWWQTATPEQFKSIQSNIVSQLGAERAAPVLDAIKQYQSVNTDRIIDEYVQTGANVIPAALRYKNPLVYDFEGNQYREQKYSDLVNQALQHDHDAVILKNTYDPGVGEAKLIDVGVVFDPKNIRSKFAAFDPEHTDSTDITKAHGGIVHMSGGGAKPKTSGPSVMTRSGISDVANAIKNREGQYGVRRVERAADEIPNLESLYTPQALADAFSGDNARALMTMNPADFEKYAAPIGDSFKLDIYQPEQGRRLQARGEGLLPSINGDEYIKHLAQIKQQGGFSDIPYLNVNKEEQGLPDYPFISGHEGRHRNRAMAASGEQAGLVQFLPRAELREPFPRRMSEQYIDAIRKEMGLSGNFVLPQKYHIPSDTSLNDVVVNRPAIELPELYANGGAVRMAGGGRPPLYSLGETATDEYIKAELARLKAEPTVPANSATETANYARSIAERDEPPMVAPGYEHDRGYRSRYGDSGIDTNRYYNPFSVLEKPTYGSEVPGAPTIDQQRYELTMKGQQEAANKRYRAQQGDALAGMDPNAALGVADAARTASMAAAALPIHALRQGFHFLQNNTLAGAPTGHDYDEAMAPKTEAGAEILERLGEVGSAITGSEMGFGMHPNLWTYTPPTLAQMRAGLKLHGEKVAPVIKDIGAIANERYLTGQMPGMVAPASPVTTWHGTGHNIEGNKFSNEKIGTGEGNQAFGYGHYSAEARPVAEWYKDILSIDPNQGSEKIKYATLEKFLPNESPDVQEQIKGFLSGLGYYDRFVTTIKREGSDALKAALLKEEPLLFSSGNLYKIDIPDPVVEKMLDWDKPLKDQSPHVQKALAKISPDQYGPDSPDYDPSETGGMIYQRVVSIANSKVSPEWIKKRDLLMKKVQAEGDSAMPELTAHLDTFPRPDKLGSELLLKNGIPGNKYLDQDSRLHGGEPTKNFVVFDPKYAKFLEKNDEAIEQPKATPAKPEKALAPANEQGFYSPTEAAALNLQRQSGNGQAFLNDLMKGDNVSSEEISGMGLDTFLKGRTSVTAAEVQDYIAQNKLQLGEARYGALTKDISESRDAFKAYGQELASKYGIPEGQNISMYAGLKNIPAEEIAKYERLQNEWLDQQPKAAKFAQWQLPGGKNYREVVITLPTEGRGLSEIELDKINRRLVDKGYDGLGEEQRAVAMRGGNEAMDMLQDLEDRVGIKTNDLMKTMAGGDPRTQYRSSHFDEPNVLAHLRMSDRVTDGKKTLLVDEVQSDWHQAARDVRTAEIKRLIDTYGVSKKDAQKAVPKDFGYKLSPEVTAKMDSEYRALVHKNADAVTQGLTPDPNDVARAKMLENQLMQSDSSRIPDAPYKDDYYQLALKRAIKEAIDGGYDRVALPTGARVNERFSLTKHINEVHYSGSNLKAYDHNGKEVISETGVRPEDLPTYVGKETANKLLEQPKQGTLRSLIGQDLEVGGEGNKKYYDEIYPTYLKNFGKKYGATVGKTTVDVRGKNEPLHYMEITPAMREEFKTGIHMKRGGKVSFASNIDAMRHELNKRQ